VSAEHAGALVEALLHLYQAKAESLHERANDLIRGEGSADGLLHTREELRSLDQAISQLGWDPGSPNRPVDVTAARDVLREAIMVAIDDAGEQVSGRCTALLRGEGSAKEVAAQIETLRGLLELLHQAEGG
jgi:hypothetical protein